MRVCRIDVSVGHNPLAGCPCRDERADRLSRTVAFVTGSCHTNPFTIAAVLLGVFAGYSSVTPEPIQPRPSQAIHVAN